MAACERAIAERARSLALRRRAVELREEASFLSAALVTTMGNFEGSPLGGRGDSFELRVPVLPVALKLVRREFRRWLETLGVTHEEIFGLTLAASEACANAMEHPLSSATHAIEIRADTRGAVIEIVVRDFGSWSAESGEGDRGRGLEMIRALVDDASVVHGERGTTVTMRRTLREGLRQSGRQETGTST
jgi:anti-sigma regulatory factor (Ser/Thr protein kinase)